MNIIVLDASSTVRTKIEKLLLDLERPEIDVILFDDALEALDYIDMNDVDIIFSAIELKGLDGMSFVDLIVRKYPQLISRLFIVTSNTNMDTFSEMKEVGAKRFIKKPINEEYFHHFVIPEINKIIKKSS